MGASAPTVRHTLRLIIFDKPVAGASALSLTRFLGRARRAAGLRGRVTVLITGSAEMRGLNRRFRSLDQATDVLSFPAAHSGGDEIEGDIAISADIAARNAARLGHSAADEVKILVLHGMLHLAGFDHEQDRGQMARLESRLRRELRLPDGLIERAGQAKTSTRPKHRTKPPGTASTRRKRTTNNQQRPAGGGGSR